MRRCALLLSLFMLAIPTGLSAQTQEQITQALDEVDSNRRELVSLNLPLDAHEAEGFWKTYGQYRAAVRKLEERSIQLGIDFARDFDSMSEEQAARLTRQALELRAGQLALKQEYLPKFERSVGAKKALRFFQIENRMDTLSEYEGQGLIPLLK